MATQGLPITSGGLDVGRQIGNVFILWLGHPSRQIKDACRAAAAVYFGWPARFPATYVEPAATATVRGGVLVDPPAAVINPALSTKTKGKKSKGKSKGRASAAKDAAPMVAPAPDVAANGNALAANGEQRLPVAPSGPSVDDLINDTEFILLTPNQEIDHWERDRSRGALIEYLRLTPMHSERVQWLSFLAGLRVPGVVHPAERLAASTGRAAEDDWQQQQREAIKRRKESESVSFSASQRRNEGPGGVIGEEGGGVDDAIDAALKADRAALAEMGAEVGGDAGRDPDGETPLTPDPSPRNGSGRGENGGGDGDGEMG